MLPSLPPPGSFDSDPVVNTIRQLRKEDRRDRDMCCGECTGGRGGEGGEGGACAVVSVLGEGEGREGEGGAYAEERGGRGMC